MLSNFGPESFSVAAIIVIFAVSTFHLKLLSWKGIIFASLAGVSSYAFGGLSAFLALLIFYILGEAATRIPKNTGKEHGQRTESNIFGNCGAAILALFFGSPFAFFGAISAAMADTISSEIGMLSKNRPVLITNLKEVDKGTDGGVSFLGFASSLVAAAVIGLLYYFSVEQSTPHFVIITIAGFLGGVVDSILGAVMQRRGVLDNTGVNFFASASGALIALALATLI